MVKKSYLEVPTDDCVVNRVCTKECPILGERNTTKRGCTAFHWENYYNSDSGRLCLIVGDAYPVKRVYSGVLHVMCTLYARHLKYQENELSRVDTEFSRTITSNSLKYSPYSPYWHVCCIVLNQWHFGYFVIYHPEF